MSCEDFQSKARDSSGPCVFCYKTAQNCDDGIEFQQIKSVVRRFFSAAVEQLAHLKSSSFSSNFYSFQNGINLCEDCFKIVDSFCSISHQIKCLELHLNWELEKLRNVMRFADRVPSRVKAFRLWTSRNVGDKARDDNNLDKFQLSNGSINEFLAMRRSLIKHWSTHLSNRFPKIILAKCELGTIQNSSTPPPVRNERNGPIFEDVVRSRGLAFSFGWLFSIAAITLLSQDDKMHALVSAVPILCEPAEIDVDHGSCDLQGPKETSEVINSAGSSSEDEDIANDVGVSLAHFHLKKEQINANDDLKIEWANDMESNDSMSSTCSVDLNLRDARMDGVVSLADVSSNSPSADVHLELQPEPHTTESPASDTDSDSIDETGGQSGPFTLDKSDPEPFKQKPATVLNSSSHHAAEGKSLEHNPSIDCSLKPDSVADQHVAEFKYVDAQPQQTSRRLRSVQKCSICLSTFSNADRFQLHQKSCKKMTNSEEEEIFSTDEDNNISSTKISPAEYQDGGEEGVIPDHDWKLNGNSDSSSSSNHEMVSSESESDASFEERVASVNRKRGVKLPVQKGKPRFQCPDCPERFRRKTKFNLHRTTHLPASRNKFCTKITPDGLSFLDWIYKWKAKFKCTVDQCGKKYHREEDLDHHSKLHGIFPCSLCGQEETYAPDLAIHEAEHANNSDIDGKGFKCSRCTYEVSRKAKVKGHYVAHFLETHLGISNERVGCPLCEASFSASIKNRSLLPILFKHYSTRHGIPRKGQDSSKSNVLTCDKCPAYFLRLIHLETHQRRAHGNKLGERKYRCSDCGKGFKTSSTLINHRISIHKVELSISCEVEGCEKKFETVANLESHKMQVHGGGMPVQICSVCGKKCIGDSALKRHLALHDAKLQDGRKKDLTRTCEQCGKILKDNRCLQMHLLSHSGPESWEFTCDVCGKKCMKKQLLEQHLRTHTKAKPFVCEICGQAYAHRHNLLIHINNKHGKGDIHKA